jgi:hypothetical protein
MRLNLKWPAGAALTAALLGCEPVDQQSSAGIAAELRSATSSTAAMPALDQAVLAFEGGFTRQEIRERLDVALRLYSLSATEENYSRAGSALVALRKQNGTPEMAILGYMIRSHVEGVNLSFPEAAAFASVFLATGDR